MHRILILVPCFNEAQTIYATIVELKESLGTIKNHTCDIVVVNDCSTDNSLEEINKAAVKCINLPINLGIGGAMQTGYQYAQKMNYDIAVQFDGDGQHDPNYITTLLQPIINNTANVVVGSRFVKKQGFQSSYLRRIGIKYFSFLNKTLVNIKILDATSGFRAFDKKVIETVCKYYPENYPEPESIILFSFYKYKVIEVPVLMRAREGGKSSISGLKTVFYMFKVTVGSIFLYIRLTSNENK